MQIFFTSIAEFAICTSPSIHLLSPYWVFKVEPSEPEDNAFENADGGRMPSL